MKTLFKNGCIYDGSGAKPAVGDVLIEDDRILQVGGTIQTEADKIVDLTGLQICPGLIETAEKAAEIYMKIAHLPRVNTITDDMMHQLEERFGVKGREGYLD